MLITAAGGGSPSGWLRFVGIYCAECSEAAQIRPRQATLHPSRAAVPTRKPQGGILSPRVCGIKRCICISPVAIGVDGDELSWRCPLLWGRQKWV